MKGLAREPPAAKEHKASTSPRCTTTRRAETQKKRKKKTVLEPSTLDVETASSDDAIDARWHRFRRAKTPMMLLLRHQDLSHPFKQHIGLRMHRHRLPSLLLSSIKDLHRPTNQLPVKSNRHTLIIESHHQENTFGFDISEFVLDDEEITSQPLSVSEDLKSKLKDIAGYLDIPIDSLVVDTSVIKSRVYDIQDQLDIGLIKNLLPAAHLDSYQLQVSRARQQMLDREAYILRRATWESAVSATKKKKEDLDSTSAAVPSLIENLEKLKQHKTELEMLLADVNANIQSAEQAIINHPASVETCREEVKAAIIYAQKELKLISGTDATDAALINEAD
uniref:DUF1409 domain-containing protein n=1 Tax=Leersia perrieri TaxID=77586 RepID=A0A0D9WEH6_9ORYZ